jgi:hypothetical protein
VDVVLQTEEEIPNVNIGDCYAPPFHRLRDRVVNVVANPPIAKTIYSYE